MNQKIWYALCLLFVVYNLKLLVDGRNQVDYIVVEEEDDLYDPNTYFLLCSPFSSIKQHDTLGRSDWPPNEVVSVQTFLNRSFRSIETRLNVTDLFKPSGSFVFNRHFCFLVKKTELENESPIGDYLQQYLVRLFAFSASKIPFFYENIYEKASPDREFLLLLHKQKVYDQRYLANPNCYNHHDQYHMNRFLCLNECFTKIKNFDQGLYSYNDESNPVVLNLSYITHGVPSEYREYDPREFEKGRKKCIRKCPENDCFWETYNTIKVRKSYYDMFLKNQTERIQNWTTAYVPMYVNKDLAIQMLSFLTLFTGSSIVGLVPMLISHLVIRLNLMNKFKYVRQVLPKIRLTLILFSFAFVLSHSMSMVNDFKRAALFPNRTTILNFSFELEPISLMLCFPIELLVSRERQIKKGRNSELLANRTFGQIEHLTNSGFDHLLYAIELKFGSTWNTNNLRKEISDEVYFTNESFKCSPSGRNVSDVLLTRCFRLNFHVEELRYRKMVPISFLWIGFLGKCWKIFIIGRNQTFHSGLYEFRGEYLATKLIWSHSKQSKKLNCTNYPETGEEFNCKSQGECIDQCINRRFLQKYHQISTRSTINKAHFQPFLLDHVRFNDTPDPAIEADCKSRFRVDCSGVRFIESLKPTFRFSNGGFELNLNFDNMLDKDLEPSLLKLWMDIATVVCLFFAVNLTSILIQSFSVLKKIFRLRWYRMYAVVIFLICLTGFLIHQFMLFSNLTRYENLKDNGHFQKLDKYQMPNSILCFFFDESKVDRNYLVTGNYLDSISSDLAYEKVFDRIQYWNGTHLNVIKTNETRFEKNRYSNSEIELTFFLFLNLKCFEILLKPAYREVDYMLFKNKVILEVFFNESFTNNKQRSFVTFLYRQNGSKQFSGIFTYSIGRPFRGSNRHYSYQIFFEALAIERNDIFEFLKRPLSLFYGTVALNDVTRYIHEIKQKFTQRYRLATREILVEDESDLDLEQNDELFRQFYLQNQNQSDYFNPVTYNFRQSVYNSYAQTDLSRYDASGQKHVPDMTFALSLGSRQTLMTNESSAVNLIINILNSLSFFLNICILDLFPYFRRLSHLVDLFYQSLLHFRTFVRSNLSA